jgi:hypothetical protein
LGFGVSAFFGDFRVRFFRPEQLQNLYYAGGIAAIIVVALWIIQVAAVARMGTPPLMVTDWFAMFATRGSLGL